MVKGSLLAKLIPGLAVAGVLAASALAAPAQIISLLSGYGYSYGGPNGGIFKHNPDASACSPICEDVFVGGTDNRVYQNHWNGTSFGGWVVVPNGILTAGPGSVAESASKTDVFVRGTDRRLWMTDTVALGTWKNLGGILTSGPDADSWITPTLHVDVYVRGTDKRMWHKWQDNGGPWRGWENLDGVLNSDPSATSWGNNRADVFVRGTDFKLYHKWWN